MIIIPYLGAPALGLVHHDLAGLLLEDGQDQRVGGVHGVGDELAGLVKLQGEGSDVLHHLGSVLKVCPGNVGHHPVDVHLGQQSGDTRVQQHEGVEGSSL